MARLTLDDDLIRAYAGETYYARGRAYHRQGAVVNLYIDGLAVNAIVAGTRRYRVHLDLTEDGLDAECSCPLGVEGLFCKHIVATALAWLDEAGEDAATAAGRHRSKPDLAAFLAGQPTAWLVERLLRVAETNSVLRAEWETLATESHTDGPDLSRFRRQLERSLIVPDYLDWAEASTYVQSAYEAIASIEDILDRGLAVAAVELAEDALRLLEAAVEQVDQNGEMSGVLESVQDLHLRACVAARPDPVMLADRLTRWAIDSEWGVFSSAVDDYADIYGDAGIQRYREIVSAEWSALPTFAPGQTAGHDTRHSTLERLRLSLAETPEERVEVLSWNLSTPHRFITIAGVLSDAGRFDEALRWLRDAQSAFGDDRHERLDQAVADLLRRAGHHEEAAEAEWDCFRRQPGLRSFQRLAEHLRPLPTWEQWRAKALALLERPAEPDAGPPHAFAYAYGNSRLVEVLLWDGDIEGAWAAAQRGGCDSAGWLRAARARAGTHPSESIPVLVRVIEAARATASSRTAYNAVASQLAELRTWHHRAGTDAEFTDYLHRIRTDHKNRPAFQDELDRAGLP
jgi:uncharacterized Zn finger protein